MKFDITRTQDDHGAVVTVREQDRAFTRFIPKSLIEDQDIGKTVEHCEISVMALILFAENRAGDFTQDGFKIAIGHHLNQIGDALDAVVGRAKAKKIRYLAETEKLRTPIIDRGNNADAIKRADVRKWFSGLTVPQKAEAITSGDQTLLTAILEVGPVIAGIDEQLHRLAVEQYEIAQWSARYFNQAQPSDQTKATYEKPLPDPLTIADFVTAGRAAFNAFHGQAEALKLAEQYIRGVVDLVALFLVADSATAFDRLLGGSNG